MPRIIVLDSFPLSSVGKNKSNPPSVTDYCRQWVMDCIAAGNSVRVPAIAYYETLRELERLNAKAQIVRLKAFCFTTQGGFCLSKRSTWKKRRRCGRKFARRERRLLIRKPWMAT